ncbi:Uncharacterised protein [Mycobacterium tuberculosis]|nr:Uncharacterised protein [Mycobacterium tuberculosis]
MDGEPTTQSRSRGGEIRVVAHLALTLIRHDHRPDHLVHQRIGGEFSQRVDAVCGAVERRDADRDVGRPRSGAGGIPATTVQGDRGVGGDVEPDPPAVFERLQHHFGLHGGWLILGAGEVVALNEDPGTGGLGPVDVYPPGAGHLHAQHHRFARRPTSPIASRESVEVGGERHLGLRANL